MGRVVRDVVFSGFKKSVTRFAPSPTGYLHLGHVAHMLYVWGLAELLGAEVIVRIEDHDRQRSWLHYEVALLEDLEWLGFDPTNSISAGASHYRQSDCGAVYEEALQLLSRTQNVYRCVCSRKTLAGEVAPGTHGERVYPGHCRVVEHPASVPHSLRLAWELGAPPEHFTDGFLGVQVQQPELQCGDLLVRDRTGQWSYQFAVTVDDFRQDVDWVVRGEDLLESTGRQLRLARMLGRRRAPVYFHHPLVRDAVGAKLSKKQGAPAVRELRRGGMPQDAVLGEAARSVGLLRKSRRVSRGEVAGLVAGRHGESIATASRRA